MKHKDFIDVIPRMPCQKLIVDNVLEGLWTRKNPYSTEFTRYDRSSGT